MQFNSIEFLFCFLPLFLAAYYIFPRRLRSVVLILGSLSFYTLASAGNYWWTALLCGMTLLVYLAGRTLEKPGRGKLLGLYLAGLLAVLVYFKLRNGGSDLPPGMSFYLFQMAAYLIDLYRLRYTPVTNLLDFAGQTVMFPKLLSGPLMEPRRLQLESKYARPNLWNLRDGIQYLIIGLGMKVLLANRLGSLWTEAAVVGYAYISPGFAWLSLTGYAMQLYFDFYGYSLMAMGLGKMLGYDLPRNFDAPYAARTVSAFYRRWHISLGLWFREYLYIPLGGNRRGGFRTVLNLTVVWLATGLWHGTRGNYLVWSLVLLILIVNERLWLGKWMGRSRVISHVYVVVAILLSWVPFAIGDWQEMLIFVRRLFAVGGMGINPLDFLPRLREFAGFLAAGVFLATPLPRKLWEKLWHTTLADGLLLVLFWLSVYTIATAAQDPFLYFSY